MSRVCNTLDGPFGRYPIDRFSSGTANWMPAFGMVEVAFWFHRVQSLAVRWDVIVRNEDTEEEESFKDFVVIDRFTDPLPFDEKSLFQSENNAVFLRTNPFVGGIDFAGFNFQQDYIAGTEFDPDNPWRLFMLINGLRFGAETPHGITNFLFPGPNTAVSGERLIIRGVDLAGGRTYEHTLPMYDGGSPVIFRRRGEVIVEPYSFWPYTDATGEDPLYDGKTGALLVEDYLARNA